MSVSISGDLQEGGLTGGNGRKIQWGVLTFNSTDANGTFPVNMNNVECVLFTPIGTVATDETVSWGNTPTQGSYLVTSSGKLTAQRTGASKTSGLKVSYLVIGW